MFYEQDCNFQWPGPGLWALWLHLLDFGLVLLCQGCGLLLHCHGLYSALSPQCATGCHIPWYSWFPYGHEVFRVRSQPVCCTISIFLITQTLPIFQFFFSFYVCSVVEFYSLLDQVKSSLRDHILDILASGILLQMVVLMEQFHGMGKESLMRLLSVI